MSCFVKSWVARAVALLVAVTVSGGMAVGAAHYVITNDDVPPKNPTGSTFYTIGDSGLLTLKQQVLTEGVGIGGGYFGLNRLAILDHGKAKCVYSSEAESGDIVGIAVPTLQVASRTSGSVGDIGTLGGIGLAMNTQYLYAGFTTSNTIATFQVKAGCKLKFVGDTIVGGLQGGVVDGMAVQGAMLVVTYGDGSIESFNISAGMPVSNDDEQNSTGSRNGATYPNGVDITADGHYAIFGDTATSTIVEVSDISSGKLTRTLVYHLGRGISSSNILLSPDETFLYITNTQGGTISAAFFDQTTGTLSTGCISGKLRHYGNPWFYLGGLALQKTIGTGGAVYVAEYGSPSSIGVIHLKSANGACTLKELPKSPAADPDSPGLLSIGNFPPRPF